MGGSASKDSGHRHSSAICPAAHSLAQRSSSISTSCCMLAGTSPLPSRSCVIASTSLNREGSPPPSQVATTCASDSSSRTGSFTIFPATHCPGRLEAECCLDSPFAGPDWIHSLYRFAASVAARLAAFVASVSAHAVSSMIRLSLPASCATRNSSTKRCSVSTSSPGFHFHFLAARIRRAAT